MSRRLFAVATAVLLLAVAAAQYPPVPKEFLDGPRTGRRLSGDSITFCLDPRDSGHTVDREVARSIASALLLKPEFYVVDRKLVTEDVTNIYIELVNHCHVYLGLRLLPGTYPDWLVPTRAYYEASYVLAVADPSWHVIGDIPRSRPLGGVLGTAGDIRLLSYINARPPNQRWARHPQSSDESGLRAVVAGDLGGALVWAPALWELERDTPAFGDLTTIRVKGVSDPIGVCGAVLMGNAYLRSSLDDAIRSISSDGTVQKILERFDYPARPASGR